MSSVLKKSNEAIWDRMLKNYWALAGIYMSIIPYSITICCVLTMLKI
jgi:hypothetical protein